MNQEYVAEEIGMSGGNFGKIERGEIDINTEYLFKLAKLFDIHVSDFFDDKPMMAAEKSASYGYASKADLEELTALVKKLASEIESFKDSGVGKKKAGKKQQKKK